MRENICEKRKGVYERKRGRMVGELGRWRRTVLTCLTPCSNMLTIEVDDIIGPLEVAQEQLCIFNNLLGSHRWFIRGILLNEQSSAHQEFLERGFLYTGGLGVSTHKMYNPISTHVDPYNFGSEYITQHCGRTDINLP